MSGGFDRPRRRVGTISVIITLFVASGLIRMIDSGGAIAQEMGGMRTYLEPEVVHDVAEVETDAEMSALLTAIRNREQQLAEREAYIDRRQQTLNVAETRIEEQMNALRQAEEQLAATLAIADNAAENDVSHLTEVYERMKPAEAAGIFETMDIDFAAGFFSRMRPDSSAAIMAQLPSDLAYSISVVMAGRNARAPRE